jgi:hypothetical protein
MEAKRLQVVLPEGWRDATNQNPNGGPTYVRTSVGIINALQLSQALYKSGKIPNPSETELIELAKGLSRVLNNPRLISTKSGKCKFGLYGKAMFTTPDSPCSLSWCLSDGKNFIRATYICGVEPQESELFEVEKIVQMLALK